MGYQPIYFNFLTKFKSTNLDVLATNEDISGRKLCQSGIRELYTSLLYRRTFQLEDPNLWILSWTMMSVNSRDCFENSLSRSGEFELHPSLISRSLTERGDIKSTNRDPLSSLSEENIGFIIRGNTPLCCRHTPLSFLLINQRQICQTSIQDFVYRARYQHWVIQIISSIYSFSFIWAISMKL